MVKYSIPKTRDPFTNAPMVRAGVDPESGLERFWCSSWNDNVGSTGALIRADGAFRMYRFERESNENLSGCGFYSAVLTEPDTLWLCGDIAYPRRLTLSTGESEVFPTGGTSYLQFRGVAYAEAQKKLLFGTFVPNGAVVNIIDAESGRVLTVYEYPQERVDSTAPAEDGTFFVNFTIEHEKISIIRRWDPETEALSEVVRLPMQSMISFLPCYQGRRYYEGYGWLGADGKFADGPTPPKGAKWADANDRYALFFTYEKDGSFDHTTAYRWEYETNEVKKLGDFCDTHGTQSCLTRDGGVAGLSLYGNFVCFDADGNKTVDVMLDSYSVGKVDCVIRAREDLVIGTPFISQRLWTLDTKSGEGCDRGRASTGGGQVAQVWKLGDKVYLSSYTTGKIAEFDPSKGGSFPENPKIVAFPQHSMRPISSAQSVTTLYSAASHHYGSHGFEITSYNTVTGEAKYKDDPIPNHQMCSLYYNEAHHVLVGGTRVEADCLLAPQVENAPVLALMDPDTLECTEIFRGPDGTSTLSVLGPRDEDSYFVGVREDWCGGAVTRLGVFDLHTRKIAFSSEIEPLHEVQYSGKENEFLVRAGDTLYLYRGDGDRLVCEREVLSLPGMIRFYAGVGEVFCTTKTEIFIEKI